ncbi:hypothetical protein JOF53_008442 [Crossiella equi]|uniref:Uncharacterized protein n=1 Tax=Crossiella equi TaxID=130796 RepID=A0ABS5ASN1_9PSEU|nr:AI-2E family transporter [Crossiella equi]MBP2479570.1 hypothetical protein [Crossiella equi]
MLVALVSGGLVDALLVLALIVVVQTLEGNVLQPLLLGSAVRPHALAVVLAVATGTVLFGVLGSLLAVPVLAVARAACTSSSPSEVRRLCNSGPVMAAVLVGGPIVMQSSGPQCRFWPIMGRSNALGRSTHAGRPPVRGREP